MGIRYKDSFAKCEILKADMRSGTVTVRMHGRDDIIFDTSIHNIRADDPKDIQEALDNCGMRLQAN